MGVSYEDGIAENPAEYRSAVRPSERDSFFNDMYHLSFEELRIKYGLPATVTFIRKVKAFIRKILISTKIIGGVRR